LGGSTTVGGGVVGGGFVGGGSGRSGLPLPQALSARPTAAASSEGRAQREAPVRFQTPAIDRLPLPDAADTYTASAAIAVCPARAIRDGGDIPPGPRVCRGAAQAR